jgi:hypothetical protein
MSDLGSSLGSLRIKNVPFGFFKNVPFGFRRDDVEERIVVGRSPIVVITLRVISRHAQRDANRAFEAQSRSFLLACTPVENQHDERFDLGVDDRADHHASPDETSRGA